MVHRLVVSDLIAAPGTSRTERLEIPISVDITSATVAADAEVEAVLRSLTDGVVVRGTIAVDAGLTCTRCLTTWNERIVTSFEQVFRDVPEDEDGELPLVDRIAIDIEPPVHDEVVLALPTAPRCRRDCLGLCPTCGTDLNTDPCDGHGDEDTSPFAALENLFES